MKDKLSKKSLGYGFVKFVREEDAASAIEAKNGFLMGHKKLKVSLARPPSTEIRNCKLYITNLPKEFTDREVTDLFAQVRTSKLLSMVFLFVFFLFPSIVAVAVKLLHISFFTHSSARLLNVAF